MRTKSYEEWLDLYYDEIMEHFYKQGIDVPTRKQVQDLYNIYADNSLDI